MATTTRTGSSLPAAGSVSIIVCVRVNVLHELDSRRPCLVTFADYGWCLHTYLSCANTLQTRDVLQTFVDADTKLSDVAVDTKQYI